MPAADSPRSWTRLGTVASLAGCGLIGGDLLLHLGHGLGHAALNLTLAGAAVLWLRRGGRATGLGLPPTSVEGWLERCEGLLDQFQQLQQSPPQPPPGQPALQASGTNQQQRLEQQQRHQQLRELRTALRWPQLRLAVAGTWLPATACRPQLVEALSSRHALTLHWGEPLDRGASGWSWPQGLMGCDVVLYCLALPLSAADLRWLEARPAGQPAWVLAHGQPRMPSEAPELQRLELTQQLQHIAHDRLLLWDGDPDQLAACLEPLSQTLHSGALELKQSARVRQAEELHQLWLLELEQLRRQHWRLLLHKTQWLVAAGVLAAPATSLDLLVLTAANGLMLKEMARLWNCPWTFEQLRAAATELGQAALALGVIEWSNQALADLLRLHGASWLVGGALQALSAAYLTRVVGRAMADTLALSAGLSEPNLALIKTQAPQLVMQAAEAEKIDWMQFLEQGRTWLQQQRNEAPPQAIRPQFTIGNT